MLKGKPEEFPGDPAFIRIPRVDDTPMVKPVDFVNPVIFRVDEFKVRRLVEECIDLFSGERSTVLDHRFVIADVTADDWVTGLEQRIEELNDSVKTASFLTRLRYLITGKLRRKKYVDNGNGDQRGEGSEKRTSRTDAWKARRTGRRDRVASNNLLAETTVSSTQDAASRDMELDVIHRE